MRNRILKLSNKQIADFCFENGWRKNRLPYGFPKASDIVDVIDGNFESLTQEAYEVSPHLNLWEYLALRMCNDDYEEARRA